MCATACRFLKRKLPTRGRLVFKTRVRFACYKSKRSRDRLSLQLKAACDAIDFLTPTTRGLTLGYGIFIRSDWWGDRSLIVHELAHVAQYERLGGILPFLRRYLFECLTMRYTAAPLELEAIAVPSKPKRRDCVPRFHSKAQSVGHCSEAVEPPLARVLSEGPPGIIFISTRTVSLDATLNSCGLAPIRLPTRRSTSRM